METQRKFEEGKAKGLDSFAARTKAQVYCAASLSRAYGEVIYYSFIVDSIDLILVIIIIVIFR